MNRFAILTAALLLAGCDSARVYEVNHDFKDAVWPASDTSVFDFSIDDSNRQYNVILNVRTTIDFKTVRLFTQYQLADSSSNTLRQRLIEQNLFDKKTGEPFGDSGVGAIYDHHVVLEPNITFPYKGTYRVKLNHMMRTDSLEEILSVGVRVEKTP